MNKTEKIICIVLGAVLVWYLINTARNRPAADATRPAAQTAAAQPAAPAGTAAAQPQPQPEPAAVPPAPKTVHSAEERVIALENDELRLEFTSWGASVKRAELRKYARDCGELSETNPAVSLDFSENPLGALEGEAPADSDYAVGEVTSNSVEFTRGALVRRYTLEDGYRLTLSEKSAGDGAEQRLSLGVMRMGANKNDLLSIDSYVFDNGEGKSVVQHHCEGESPLRSLLAGGLAGGCSGVASAEGWPAEQTRSVPGRQGWVAVKNRFFVTALCSSTAEISGFDTTVSRAMNVREYRPESVRAQARVAAAPERVSVFYIGPKKLSLLSDLGMREVMEFGMWSMICYPLVWVLNFFHDVIPSYGIAIILLTILVRIIFWPLTHKSTVSMRRMQEVQPKMKEIQTKFKGNPQRMQQEIWALYKAEKVNPLSSCLPMLVQIPVFIALFNVLRSAVELRYASFLWISDLSAPEALFASWFPFGGLNLLPILMAVTTGLQSAFTPSTGDNSQKKMMMIFMPLMMLVMFYSFPSALSLYWFLSNLISIAQMWLIRRQAARKQAMTAGVEVINPPETRQMRRHG